MKTHLWCVGMALAAACTGPSPAQDASIDRVVLADGPRDDTATSPDITAPTDDVPAVPTDTGTTDAMAATDAADVGLPSAFGLDIRPRNATCRVFDRPSGNAGVTLARAYPNQPTMSNVVAAVQRPGDNSAWYLLEKIGRVRRMANNPTVTSASMVLDITARVSATASEAGLLGIAFHPDFARNNQVYLEYTRTMGGRLETVVSRFVSRDAGMTLDGSSEQVVFTVAQPYDNHNGGTLAFGPDGMLYIGLGDGGSGGDPMGLSQNTNALLGKMLRIDVTSAPPMGQTYVVPPSNPFVGRAGYRPEIWAIGLRNPWKFSFDTATGDLWAGDVGQGALEEVDLIRRGGNYGWRTMEGTRCFNPASGCNMAGLALPVVTYPRSDGVSITGGFVYRGAAIPALVGRYVYGDYVSRNVWAVRYDAMGRASAELLLPGAAVAGLSSFAQDQQGEVYLLGYTDGRLHRLGPMGTPVPDRVPRTLSATGCFAAGNVRQPAEGVIPYQVNAALWSDGAEKERYFAIPEGTTITVGADGDFDFPNGSVLIKTFVLAGRPVETRLFVRHTDGVWAGYTYAYNAAGTDADLLPSSDTRTYGTTTWSFPSRGDCMQCHTAAAGFSLGLELAQLNGEQVYSTGRRANQLATLEHIGLFASPLPMPPAMLPALPSYTGAAPLGSRARAYLHANCASCHQPGGTGRGNMDLRFATAAGMTNTCNVMPTQGDLGVAGAQVLRAGDAMRSLISLRMHRLDASRMPPLATRVVDTQGTALLDAYIESLMACP
ncbi:MAG: PQQ-dependent sugar dehydrogenase [Deltaproteobacteria bacterium]|nr:PQQ-dependent sugar dehydrogenase [Deltaproteobacteria bacterium]